MYTLEVARWINEREAIRMRKAVLEDYAETGEFQLSEAGREVWVDDDPDVWQLSCLTNDPILNSYRFCNVRREDDRVTRWIRENILVPYADHEFLPIMICIARTINWPPTLQRLIESPDGWPADSRFSPERMSEVLMDWQAQGQKVYTGAYMIRAESDKRKEWYSWPKQRYISEIVIGALWKNRYDWQHLDPDGTQQSAGVWEYLQMFTGWGPFMAYQAVVDMQHTYLLRDAEDNQTWAAAGPGTKRGLNRWRGVPAKAPLNQAQALENLLELRTQLNKPGTIWPWLQPIDLSDVCNVCCEFDKMERVRLGEGKPRSKYVPGRGY